MSKNTPFIGSKISLISKAEIRYEGTLYQVDADNSTVTLAKVRSFGTEGRSVPKQILPRSEVYEFIIFRGNDIKDLNVSEMPGQQNDSPGVPQDPAILSAHSSAPSAVMPPGPAASHPPAPPAHPPSIHAMPPAGGPPAQPPPPYYAHTPPQGFAGGFGMPYFRPPVVRHPQPPSIPPSMPPTIPPTIPPAMAPVTASPQTTSKLSPQVTTVTSSGAGHLVAVVTPQGPLLDSSPDQVTMSSAASTTGTGVVTTPSVAVPSSLESKPQASSTPLMAASESDSPLQPLTISASVAESVLPLDREPPIDSSHSASRPHAAAVHRQHASSPGAKAPSAFQAVQHSPHRQYEGRGRRGSGSGQESVDGGRKKMGRAREYSHRESGGASYRSNNTGYQGYSRGGRENYQYHRGRGGGGGGRRNDGRQNQERPLGDRSTFKYDSEFDFETANARFKKEDLEDEFRRMRLDDRARKLSEGSGRKASTGSGNEESSGEDAEIIEDGESVSDEVEEFYDKTKSFFDNISCEHNAGSAKRPTRNEEREVNTETFGVSSVNNNYSYNRRRNWRGRSRGGDYRGDYRGGGRGRYRSDDGRYRNDDGRYGGRGGRGRGGRSRGRGGGRGSHRTNNYESFSPTPL